MACRALASKIINKKLMMRCLMLQDNADDSAPEADTEGPAEAVAEAASEIIAESPDVLETVAVFSVTSESMLWGP